MKIGLVGYQGSGKSSLFEWLTGTPADPALSHTIQTAMAPVADRRIDQLRDIYHPKKTTRAALEIVDTPGLSRTGQANASRLALIREAGCLALVVAAFGSSDPMADVKAFQEDLLLADLEVVSGRVDRLVDSLKKPRPNREQLEAELAAIEPLVHILEEGRPVERHMMSDQQYKATRAYQLLTEKPQMIVVSVADDEQDAASYERHGTEKFPVIAVPIRLELELARMSPEEADEFRREMGIAAYDRDAFVAKLMDASGQMLFFTIGDKEVRSWMIPKGATALEAAGNVHSDMARGFIRAEIFKCDDLVRLGSERELRQNHLVRQEHKDYVMQDGEIMIVRFSV
jgi:hypothetical protein